MSAEAAAFCRHSHLVRRVRRHAEMCVCVCFFFIGSCSMLRRHVDSSILFQLDAVCVALIIPLCYILQANRVDFVRRQAAIAHWSAQIPSFGGLSLSIKCTVNIHARHFLCTAIRQIIWRWHYGSKQSWSADRRCAARPRRMLWRLRLYECATNCIAH